MRCPLCAARFRVPPWTLIGADGKAAAHWVLEEDAREVERAALVLNDAAVHVAECFAEHLRPEWLERFEGLDDRQAHALLSEALGDLAPTERVWRKRLREADREAALGALSGSPIAAGRIALWLGVDTTLFGECHAAWKAADTGFADARTNLRGGAVPVAR
ncbi:MAG: hypothetical protein SF028_00775 [Candidatus Sumerlaeia bacterium]|nr:hypothetical protein [Candidatus Sumerlaeia bacterium]